MSFLQLRHVFPLRALVGSGMCQACCYHQRSYNAAVEHDQFHHSELCEIEQFRFELRFLSIRNALPSVSLGGVSMAQLPTQVAADGRIAMLHDVMVKGCAHQVTCIVPLTNFTDLPAGTLELSE